VKEVGSGAATEGLAGTGVPVSLKLYTIGVPNCRFIQSKESRVKAVEKFSGMLPAPTTKVELVWLEKWKSTVPNSAKPTIQYAVFERIRNGLVNRENVVGVAFGTVTCVRIVSGKPGMGSPVLLCTTSSNRKKRAVP
jgi:hypothetical protein